MDNVFRESKVTYFGKDMYLSKKNILITGAPGSGKTFMVERIKDFVKEIDKANELFRYGLLKSFDLDSFGHMTHNREANWYIDSQLTALQFKQFHICIGGGIIYPLTKESEVHYAFDITPSFGVWYSQLEKRMNSSEKSDKEWERQTLSTMNPEKFEEELVRPIQNIAANIGAEYVRISQNDLFDLFVEQIRKLYEFLEEIRMH